MNPTDIFKTAIISPGNIIAFTMLTGCLTSTPIADSEKYQVLQSGVAEKSSNDCVIESAGEFNDALIFHYDCSHVAIDTEPVVVSEHFTIPPQLQHRVNFWKTIYTKLSVRDYALHLRDHPEVVLEVIRFPWLNENGQHDKKSRKIIRERKKYYSTIFQTIKKLNRAANTDETRIASLITHIKDNKRFPQSVSEIRSQKGQREYILRGLEMSSGYLSHIEAEFENKAIPKDLAKIAFVESSFNLKAVSKVGASGVYQLMPFVARKYLRVSDHIDERRDPLKAGIAAAEVLKTNYKILGNWPLAITAYNHGPFGIKRAVNKAGSDDITYLIENYEGPSFGFASKNFYAQFLTMLQIVNSSDQYFPEASLTAPIRFRPITLNRPTRAHEIRKLYGIDTEELHELNPDISKSFLRRNGRLPRGYTVKLPEIERITETNDSDKAIMEPTKDIITN